jgi:hypothetical protein
MKNQRLFLTLFLLPCLCFGVSAGQVQAPVAVMAWGYTPLGQTTVPVEAQSGVVAIAAGGAGIGFWVLPFMVHTLALKSDGSVVGWGDNFYGQATGTPTGSAEAASGAVLLGGQVLRGVIAIAAGGFHSVALSR